MSDQIVVLRAGVIQQVAPPLEIYERPANAFVAAFIGSPRSTCCAPPRCTCPTPWRGAGPSWPASGPATSWWAPGRCPRGHPRPGLRDRARRRRDLGDARRLAASA